MRNLAIRWNKESRLSLPLGEADDPVADDSHQRVADDEDAQIVLRAFRSLPHRWQQVLWLAEVDEEPRPAIATHLKMSPNSVSALLRRARHGLRYRCLTEHVPEPLRSDRSHVARVLPDLVTGKLAPDMVVKVTAHLAGCGTCREVHSDLRGLSRRVKHATLGTLGFGALTVLFKDLGTVGVAVAATAAAGSAAAGTAAGGNRRSSAGDGAGTPVAHQSYGQNPPFGKRLNKWSNTFTTTEAVFGNRGPGYVETAYPASGRYNLNPTNNARPGVDSNTLLIHGGRNSWEGNIGYNDGHVAFETKPNPDGVTYRRTAGTPLTVLDNLFIDETDEAGQGTGGTGGPEIHSNRSNNLIRPLAPGQGNLPRFWYD